MAAYKLTIVGPQGRAFEGTCESLSAPGVEGDFGVLSGHAPMIALVRRGITRIAHDGQTTYLVTGEGVCEVTWNHVNLLVDTATKCASLDAAKAELASHLDAVAGKKK
jgi:F-type H+-transporting ATPase subunit epsilon